MKNNETLEDLIKEFKEVSIKFKDELINSGEDIKLSDFNKEFKADINGKNVNFRIYIGTALKYWSLYAGSDMEYSAITNTFYIKNTLIEDRSVIREIINKVNKEIENMSNKSKRTVKRSLKFMENEK